MRGMSLVDPVEEGRERLARAGRSLDQRVLPPRVAGQPSSCAGRSLREGSFEPEAALGEDDSSARNSRERGRGHYSTGLASRDLVPETPEELYARGKDALRVPPVWEWETLPFEGELAPRALQPPVERRAAALRRGWRRLPPLRRASDDEYIWTTERWRLLDVLPNRPGLPWSSFWNRASTTPTRATSPDELAAELGVLLARVERAIRSIGEIGRVHVCRWGDGSEHLHWWFMLYVYPRTGRPGAEPRGRLGRDGRGARGCTPQSCGYRDWGEELRAMDATVVGLSAQTLEEQREAAERLDLPHAVAADPELRLAEALRLPTFEFEGRQPLQAARPRRRGRAHRQGLLPGLPAGRERRRGARLAARAAGLTYSIVAREQGSGELGVGIQSQAFRRGAVVPWALPGVGAVGT